MVATKYKSTKTNNCNFVNISIDYVFRYNKFDTKLWQQYFNVLLPLNFLIEYMFPAKLTFVYYDVVKKWRIHYG